MAKIRLNQQNQLTMPTLILQNRNFENIGTIPDALDFTFKENFNSANECSFTIYKPANNTPNELWDSITSQKILFIPEYEERFEINVSTDSRNTIYKSITGTSLCEAELSQIKLRDIEINTEADIARDTYERATVFYDSKHPDCSLLHRLFEKTPHYSIAHVDDTLKKLERSFQLSGTDLYSALTGEIATEFNCIFLFNSKNRTISAYDLYSTCENGHRGDFSEICPECNEAIHSPCYGTDTTVFLSNENLASRIGLEADLGSLKNCFYIEGGDELMNSTIRAINPNGSQYIYHFSDDIRGDMPPELLHKIDSYQATYQEYYTDEEFLNDAESANLIEAYNTVVRNINEIILADESVSYNEIHLPIRGYAQTTALLYDVVDFYHFVKTSMMPIIRTEHMTLSESLQNIVNGFAEGFLSSDGTTIFQNEIALPDNVSPTTATVEREIRKLAKLFFNTALYHLDVTVTGSQTTDSSSGSPVWNVSFTLTSLSEIVDSGEAASETISDIPIKISNNYELYLQQKIYKEMADRDSLAEKNIINRNLSEASFTANLDFYSYDELHNLLESFRCCQDILLSAKDEHSELYENYHNFYTQRISCISGKITFRESQLSAIRAIYDPEYLSQQGDTSSHGILDALRKEISSKLDFEAYLGEDLWKLFCTYKREDTYSNPNYISDGLTNSELIENAQKLLTVANQELYKASSIQYSISTSVNNLLALPEFAPFADNFEVGNWIRVAMDDNIYKLRLLSYQINYDDLSSIQVEFSTVESIHDGISDVRSILNSARSIAQSYDSVKHQVGKSSDTYSIVNNWVSEGLKATQTRFTNTDNQTFVMDEHGLLARSYDDITDSYNPHQLKIVSNGLYTTHDNWQTIDTGIGSFTYTDPILNKPVTEYGIIAKTVVGKLFLGEELQIYGKENSIILDDNGIRLDGGSITWTTPIHSSAVEGLDSNLDTLKQAVSVTKIGEDYVISPKIVGGYLYLTDHTKNYSVEIDPSGISANAYKKYLFSIRDLTKTENESVIMGVKSDGSGYFSGEIYAQSGTIGNWNITNGSLSYGNTSSDNYMLLDAVNKCIVSESGFNKMTLASGTLKFYRNDNHYLSVQTTYWIDSTNTNTDIYGVALNSECDSKFISFGNKNSVDDVNYATALLLNYGLNPDGYTESMIVYGDTRFNGICHFGSTDHYISNTGIANVSSITAGNTTLSGSSIRAGTNGLNLKNNGYSIVLYNNTTLGDGVFRPDDSYADQIRLGASSIRWKDIYISTATNTTSDRNLKQNITPLSEKFIKLFQLLQPVSFLFKNGTSGRTHVGFISQDVETAMSAVGLTDLDFAGFCKDTQKTYHKDDDGNIIEETILDENGEPEYIYSLRYEEFIAINTYMIQNCIQRIEKLETLLTQAAD